MKVPQLSPSRCDDGWRRLWLSAVEGGAAMALAGGGNQKGWRDVDDIGSSAMLHDRGRIKTDSSNATALPPPLSKGWQ